MSDLFKKVIAVTTQGRGLRGYSVIIELAESGMIRWKQSYTGAPWNDIIDIADLKGAKGDNSHIHIKWHAEGSETLLDTPDAYIGIYADNEIADSTAYANYQWFKWKGDKGDPAPNTIWQYSADGTTWTTDATGAVYERQSGDNGVTWSAAHEYPGVAALAGKADVIYANKNLAPKLDKLARFLHHKLKSNTEPCVLEIFSDSTSNDNSEWWWLFTSKIVSLYPAYTAISRYWDTTNQCFSNPLIMQEGTDGDGYVEFSGVNQSGVNQISTSDKAPLRITGDIEIIAKIACTDYSAISPQTIVNKFGEGGNRGYNLSVTTSGGLYFWYSSNGTTNTVIQSTKTLYNSANVRDGEPIWVRCVFDADNGADGNDTKFYYSYTGISWTQIGNTVTKSGVAAIYPSSSSLTIGGRGSSDLFTGKIYRVIVKNGINGKIVASFDATQKQPFIDNVTDVEGNIYTQSVTKVVYGGTHGLLLLNGSIAGASVAYFTDETRFPLMTNIEPDLMFISLGHNQGQGNINYVPTYKTLVDAIIAKYENVGIVVVVQNPQRSPELGIVQHAIRCRQIAKYAVLNNYGLIDAFSAFMAVELADYMADGCHPNAAGSKLWANEALRFLGVEDIE